MSKKQNAEEDYITTPISVLSYITYLESQLEEANDKNIWIKKQQESWNSTTKETIKAIERQLAEAIEIAEDAINEINPDPLEGRKFTVMELHKRLEKLKEKGE